MKRQSIRSIHYSIVTFILTVVIMLSAALINSRYATIKELQDTRKIVDLSLNMFEAVRSFGFERGRVNVVFNYKGSINDKKADIEFYKKMRANGEKQITEALGSMTDLNKAALAQRVETLESARKSVNFYRSIIEVELNKDYRDRDIAISDTWFALMSDYVKAISDLALNLESLTNGLKMEGRAYLSCVAYSTLLRDNAGPVCSYLAAAILSPSSFTHEKRNEMSVRNALVDQDMQILDIAVSNLSNDKLTDALADVNRTYFGEFQIMIKDTFNTLIHGGTEFKYSQKEFTAKSVESLETIANLSKTAKTELYHFLDLKIKNHYMFLCGYIVFFVIILIYLFYSIKMLYSNVYKPIDGLIANLVSLAEGNTDVEIISKVNNDEIGDLIDSIEAYRQTQIDLKELNTSLESAVKARTSDLLNERDRLRVIIDSVPAIIFIKDLENNILMGNSAAAAAFGRKLEDFHNVSVSYLFPEYSDMVADLDRKIVETGRSIYNTALNHKRNDGSVNNYKMSKVPLKDLSGVCTNILTVIIDITEEISLEEEKRKAFEMLTQQAKMAELGNMLGVIVHQWKQPLNVMSLIAQTMEIEGEPDDGAVKYNREEMAKSVALLLENINFMNETCDNFRDYFKPSKGSETFAPFDTVNDIYKLFHTNYDKFGISVTITERSRFYTCGVQNEFKQVVLNILNNSRDALLSRDGEKYIIIETGEEDGFGCIDIFDNGGGIAAELLPDKLFDEFQSTKGAGGLGMGLYLSRRIIENSFGGTISASNTDTGAHISIKVRQHKPA